MWRNQEERARRKAARAAAPPPPKPPSSAEVAERRARQAEADGMPLSAAAIRRTIDEVPELYPRRES